MRPPWISAASRESWSTSYCRYEVNSKRRREGAQVGRWRQLDPEQLEEVPRGRHDAGRVRVRHLQVEDAVAPLRHEGLVDETGLSDAPPSRDLEKEPASSTQDLPDGFELTSTTVKCPIRRG